MTAVDVVAVAGLGLWVDDESDVVIVESEIVADEVVRCSATVAVAVAIVVVAVALEVDVELLVAVVAVIAIATVVFAGVEDGVADVIVVVGAGDDVVQDDDGVVGPV